MMKRPIHSVTYDAMLTTGRSTVGPVAVPALLALAFLGGCRSSSSGDGREGDLGRMPEVVVELFDMGKPDGLFEIELDRRGRVHALEVEVGPGQLPQGVRGVVLERMPGAQITGAEREVTKNQKAWEVRFQHEGRAWEYLVGDDLRVLDTEKELSPEETPGAVRDAAENAMPGGELTGIELLQSPERVEYHVKKSIDGAEYKIVITPNGRVVRRVRQARAELGIPLPD